MHHNSSVSKRQQSKTEPFHKLMGSELRQMYEAKLLDAPAYILLIVKTHGKAGWKWTFTVKDFCKEWGVSRSTFYRAVSKLKTMGMLHWEADEKITVWHGSDIAQDNPIDETVSPTGETASPIDETKILPMRLKTSETTTGQDVCSASDSSQIISNTTDNGVSVFEKFEERLKQNNIYRQKADGDRNVDNPKMKPIYRALAEVSPEHAERAILAFLRYAKDTKVNYPYEMLKDAILKGWEPR